MRGETKVHGQHACRALVERRAEDVRRVYVTAETVPAAGRLLSELARRRLPYKIVSAEELEKITESKHHEGLCVVARDRPGARLEEVLEAPESGPLLALADVSNPHNLGAILRIAAHFGARAALVGGAAGARLSPAAYRTAQGGAEWVPLVVATDLAPALETCRSARFTLCATSSHEGDGEDLFAAELPPRAVIMLGSEGSGLPRPLKAMADRVLRIPGTGHIESLNVASAASVVLAELWRRQARPKLKKGTRR